MYFEVLTNPLLQVNNVTKIAEIAHRYGAISIVDNTFVTPYLQLPLDQGADIVIHSATKYLAGHSEVNAGLVVVKDDELGKRVYFAQNRLGGVLAPNECDSVRRGIQTLALRMDRQQENARAIPAICCCTRWSSPCIIRDCPAMNTSWPPTVSRAAVPC